MSRMREASTIPMATLLLGNQWGRNQWGQTRLIRQRWITGHSPNKFPIKAGPSADVYFHALYVRVWPIRLAAVQQYLTDLPASSERVALVKAFRQEPLRRKDNNRIGRGEIDSSGNTRIELTYSLNLGPNLTKNQEHFNWAVLCDHG